MAATESSTAAKRGLVIIITGNGKGKTTAAFGQALRAIGEGYRICMIQFMKGRKYGEVIAGKKYLPNFTFYQFGRDDFVRQGNPDQADIDLAGQGLEKAREVIQQGKYDMVILDEINIAVRFNLIPEEAVLSLVRSRPPELDIILTGRYASDQLIASADTVSEVVEIKHHFNAGIKDRAGIEY